MNKTLFTIGITLGAVLLLVLITIGIGAGANNRAISLEEKIELNASNIDVQRKAAINKLNGLGDALDSSNARYTEVMTAITNARQDDSTVADVQLAIDVVMEAYPEGDANNEALYTTFMNEIIIINNKIAGYREVYNADVREYRMHFRKFPNSMILSIMGIEMRDFDYIEVELTEDASEL